MKKRILAFWLTGCIAFGLIGCGNAKESDVANAPAENANAVAENPEYAEVENGENTPEGLDLSGESEQQEAEQENEMDEWEKLEEIRSAYWEIDAEASQNFEMIETTEPVTLKKVGVSVTISLPTDVDDYEDFSQTGPTNVRLENGLAGGPRFILDSESSVENYLADGQRFYEDKVENNDERPNARISDIYTLDTNNGQVSILKFESEEILPITGEIYGYIGYYAALPLDNGVILKLMITESYDLQEGTPYTDDAIISMFNHCTVGSYEP